MKRKIKDYVMERNKIEPMSKLNSIDYGKNSTLAMKTCDLHPFVLYIFDSRVKLTAAPNRL